eukprot:356731-Chlamydomonas_euryale.AAC.9
MLSHVLNHECTNAHAQWQRDNGLLLADSSDVPGAAGSVGPCALCFDPSIGSRGAFYLAEVQADATANVHLGSAQLDCMDAQTDQQRPAPTAAAAATAPTAAAAAVNAAVASNEAHMLSGGASAHSFGPAPVVLPQQHQPHMRVGLMRPSDHLVTGLQVSRAEQATDPEVTFSVQAGVVAQQTAADPIPQPQGGHSSSAGTMRLPQQLQVQYMPPRTSQQELPDVAKPAGALPCEPLRPGSSVASDCGSSSTAMLQIADRLDVLAAVNEWADTPPLLLAQKRPDPDRTCATWSAGASCGGKCHVTAPNGNGRTLASSLPPALGDVHAMCVKTSSHADAAAVLHVGAGPCRPPSPARLSQAAADKFEDSLMDIVMEAEALESELIGRERKRSGLGQAWHGRASLQPQITASKSRSAKETDESELLAAILMEELAL